MTKEHRMRNGLPSTTSLIRKVLETNLKRAGDMVRIYPKDYDANLPRLRIKTKDALRSEGMEGVLKTIDGHLWIKRTDFPGQLSLPGMPPPVISDADMLHSLQPWPDDPNAPRKAAAIGVAINLIKRV